MIHIYTKKVLTLRRKFTSRETFRTRQILASATCQSLGIRQAFTSYNNPKGNTDTERLMPTLKEEFIWLRESKSPAEFIEKLDAWVEYYKQSYLHSTLAYKTPNGYEREYHIHHGTQLAAS